MSKTVFEAKNARAVSLVKSWLKAVGIGFESGVEIGVDIVAQLADGGSRGLQVDCGESAPAPEGTVILQGAAFTGRKIADAYLAFEALQRALGYNPKVAVDRGPVPETKLSYHENFEDVAFRHSELRRSPNPSTEDLTKYDACLKKATWNFIRMNQVLVCDNMLEFGDLFTYAQVWTINYLTYYQVPAEQDTHSNNERKLYSYVWQRYGELRGLLMKTAKNQFVDAETVAISMSDMCLTAGWEHDQPMRKTNAREAVASSVWSVSQSEDSGQETGSGSKAGRKRTAEETLVKKLAEMPHDRMVEVLTEAVENDRIHPDARREARNRLRSHSQTCPSCSLGNQILEVDEETSSVDFGGAEE
jgi:hypothetical protein